MKAIVVVPLLTGARSIPEMCHLLHRDALNDDALAQNADLIGLSAFPKDARRRLKTVSEVTLWRWRGKIRAATPRGTTAAPTSLVRLLRHGAAQPLRAYGKIHTDILSVLEDVSDASAALVAQTLRERGLSTLSDRRIQQIMAQEIATLDVLDARLGKTATRSITQTRLPHQAVDCNDVWIADHCQPELRIGDPLWAPLPVAFRDDDDAIAPVCYFTLIIDDFSRLDVSFRVWGQTPTTASTMLALLDAIRLYGKKTAISVYGQRRGLYLPRFY